VHDGETIAVRTPDNKLHWLDPNHVGTAQLTIDADTQEVTRRRTDPFGGARGTPAAAWPGQQGFVGGTADPDTGLTQLGERAYDPATGKFISTDPEIDFTEPQQLNAYAYANNSPVTYSDPDGRFWTIVARVVITKVVVPLVRKVIYPVLKRFTVWVARAIWSGLGWLARQVGVRWTAVTKTVTVWVEKTSRSWSVKLVRKTVKTRIWKPSKNVAKKTGKNNVKKVRKPTAKPKKSAKPRKHVSKPKNRKIFRKKSSGPRRLPNVPYKVRQMHPDDMGETDKFGNITIQRGLTKKEFVETVRHESVHRLLSPKRGPFKNARANITERRYEMSHLWRFAEETAAETYATGSLLKGLSLAKGYVGWQIAAEGAAVGAAGYGVYEWLTD
jgi:RHS repeat-associated protein